MLPSISGTGVNIVQSLSPSTGQFDDELPIPIDNVESIQRAILSGETTASELCIAYISR